MIATRSARRVACAAVLVCTGASGAHAGELARTIDAGVAKIGKDAKVSIAIRSVTTGETLYARDADEPRAPASTMKLATTAAAIELLGPTFEHETTVHASGRLGADGRLEGDLVIRGSGDPSIARRFQLDDEPLLADWAAELAKKVRVIEGDVVADDRAFERLGFHPDWNPNEAHEWYAAEVSALNLNDNCIDVETAPEGSGVRVLARPETHAIVLDVKATTTASKRDHRLAYVREGDRTIRIAGKVWSKAMPYEAPVAVTQPALLFASVLHERLVAAGVVVKGKARLAAEKDAAPSGTPLLTRRSPLLRALATCNKNSQNLYAECLLKTLGSKKGALGSWDEGSKVVTHFLESLGVRASEVCVRDGSGLSRQNRLSANALVRVLESVSKGENGRAFTESLSIAGVDGTLERRLHDLPSGVTFRGKTGTMHGVCSLAGLLELEHGAGGQREVIAVAFVVNGTRGAAAARQAQDDAIRAIVRSRKSVSR